MFSGSDQTGDVSHIDKEQSSNLVSDLTETGKVDDARIGTCTGKDHTRLVFDCEFFDLIIVDTFGFAADSVGDHIVKFAGKVQRMTVGQVPAVIQTHGKHGISSFRI